MDEIKIILADDHTLVRAGIRSLLNSFEDIKVCAEAENGREALKIIEIHKPDIAILDIAMNELNGLETAQHITRDFPEVKSIMLSMHASEEYVLQALKAGASAYLLKESAPTELEIAIRAVYKGETYLSPIISKHVVDDYLRRISNTKNIEVTEPRPHEILTIRQREVLQLIAEGNSTKEIADKLIVSIKTIETHRAQIMERLGIKDIAGLVRYAIRMGIISNV